MIPAVCEVPAVAPCSQADVEAEAKDCLQELEALRCMSPGDGTRASLSSWCLRAASTLFAHRGLLTAVGRQAVNSLALFMSDHPEMLSPEMSAWVSSCVLPCLLNEEGVATSGNSDLLYALLRAVLLKVAATDMAPAVSASAQKRGVDRTPPPRKAARPKQPARPAKIKIPPPTSPPATVVE